MNLPPHGPDEVRRIAALARIRLRDDEAEHLARDFGRILEYVGRLRERAVDDTVEPLVHPVPPADAAATLRPDAPADGGGDAGPLPRETVRALASPEGYDDATGLLRVPRVLEEGR